MITNRTQLLPSRGRFARGVALLLVLVVEGAALPTCATLPAARLPDGQARLPQERREPQPTEQQEPTFDPYHAEKSIEIGLYYMKKGNYDAAIERFQQAARLKPHFARPYRLLGEAHEKKGEKGEALTAYQTYLDILPSAGDAAAIRKRMAKLRRALAREAQRRSR